MSRLLRFSLWFASLALFVLSPFLMYAQESGSPMSVTGCLKQGTEKGGYYVAAQDGEFYELIGQAASFAQHVNHTVTVMGHEIKLPESQEAKMEPHEKSEAAGGSYVDFRVTEVKMVSPHCQ